MKDKNYTVNNIKRELRGLTNYQAKKQEKKIIKALPENDYQLQLNFIVMTSEFTILADIKDKLKLYLNDIQTKVLDISIEKYKGILIGELKYAFSGIQINLSDKDLFNFPLTPMDQVVFDDLQKSQLCGVLGEYYPRHPGVRNVGHYRFKNPACKVINSPVHKANETVATSILPAIEFLNEGKDTFNEEELNEANGAIGRAIDDIIISATSLVNKI